MSRRFEFSERCELQSEKLLVEAASIGDLDTVVTLLENGVSVDAKEYNKSLFYASKNYMTPLQMACANGYIGCVELLIASGADVNAKDRFDVTALHMAAEKGNYACLRALLDANAECSLPTKFSKTGCYTAVPYLGGTTPLHLAAQNNNIECVKELIQYGGDYNAIDEKGRTSLYIAAQRGYSDCVLAHLKNAVGKDILSLPSFSTLDTPLHFAVSHGKLDCVRELLKTGSDVNQLNVAGFSPLHLAVCGNNEIEPVGMELLKMLVLDSYGIDINQVNGCEFTALHYVCFNGRSGNCRRRPDMAKFLIAYGANVDIRNNLGLTLLENEMKAPSEDFEILQYIVRSMLHLPPYLKLKFTHHRDNYREALEPGIGHALEIQDIYYGGADILRRAQHLYNIRLGENQRQVQEIHNIRGDVQREVLQLAERAFSPSLDQRHTWYKKIASNPRTLQHYCRYAIRKTMKPKSLKFINKLCIPNALKSYLLLEYDE